jgi:hypothetical protein
LVAEGGRAGGYWGLGAGSASRQMEEAVNDGGPVEDTRFL